MGFPDLAGLVQSATVGTLGDRVLYQPNSGGEAYISGIWAMPYVEFDDAGTALVARRPMLDVRLSDIRGAFAAKPKKKDRVLIENSTLGEPVLYRVENVEEDGQGMAKLHLHVTNREEAGDK